VVAEASSHDPVLELCSLLPHSWRGSMALLFSMLDSSSHWGCETRPGSAPLYAGTRAGAIASAPASFAAREVPVQTVTIASTTPTLPLAAELARSAPAPRSRPRWNGLRTMAVQKMTNASRRCPVNVGAIPPKMAPPSREAGPSIGVCGRRGLALPQERKPRGTLRGSLREHQKFGLCLFGNVGGPGAGTLAQGNALETHEGGQG
jgi:hypothetical protein